MITMNKVASKVTAIVFLLIIVAPLLTLSSNGDSVGNEGGRVTCSTNLQLIPQSDSVGGGNIHWTVEGEAAVRLREALLESVGNDELFDRADGDDVLDYEELAYYLSTNGMLESYVQRGGALHSFRRHSFYGFEPRRDIDPNDYIDYYGTPITRSSLNTANIADNTDGLLGFTSDSRDSITIHFKISFRENPGPGPHEINMANLDVLKGVWESLVIPVRRELITDATLPSQTNFQIEHTDLLADSNGSYGVILRNGIREPSTNYSISSNGQISINHASIRSGDNISVVYAYTFRWVGESKLTHWTFVVGTHSFYEPEYDDGTLYIIRTPAGEILQYSIELDGVNEPNARIMWSEFVVLENPQILFLLVCIFGYFTRHFPKKYFWNYQDTYPTKHRKEAEKCKPLHILSAVALILLFVFYFIPTIGRLFISGLILIVFGVVVTVLFWILSQFIYSKKKKAIPDEILNPPKEKPKKKVSSVKRTTTIRRVGRPTEKKPNVVKTYCDWCGEFFTIHKKRNLLTVNCPSCNKKQQMLKEGFNYLLLDSEGKKSFSLLLEFITEGLPTLVITTKLPSKVDERHGLQRAKIMWLTDRTSSTFDVLDPKRLDFEITRAISNFSKENERAVIFLEGFEYLLIENSFEKVSKFIKKTTDTCSLNASTYMMYVNPSSLSKTDLSILKKEFDHIEDLRAPGTKK